MRRLVGATGLGFASVMAARALYLAGWAHVAGGRGLIDFDAFHVVARMALQGRMPDAYRYEALRPLERLAGTIPGFLPWSYPPQFALVIAPLGGLPDWLAYLLFTGGTLAAYLLVLHRLAGRGLSLALLAAFPAVFMCVACGQNGLLTGALMGLACLGLLRARSFAAGAPLGLMAIKPHLAAALGLYVLVRRRWAVAAAALGVAALGAGLATLAFGLQVWPGFLEGAHEAGRFLAAGRYPLFHMVSTYAMLRTLGWPAWPAFAVQAAVALAALGATVLACRRGLPQTSRLAVAVLASLLVSPYVYDYDLPILGVAVAVAARDLTDHGRAWEKLALVGAGWLAGGWGFGMSYAEAAQGGPSGVKDPGSALTLAGAGLLIAFAVVWRVLQRRRAPSPAAPGPALAQALS